MSLPKSTCTHDDTLSANTANSDSRHHHRQIRRTSAHMDDVNQIGSVTTHPSMNLHDVYPPSHGRRKRKHSIDSVFGSMNSDIWMSLYEVEYDRMIELNENLLINARTFVLGKSNCINMCDRATDEDDCTFRTLCNSASLLMESVGKYNLLIGIERLDRVFDIICQQAYDDWKYQLYPFEFVIMYEILRLQLKSHLLEIMERNSDQIHFLQLFLHHMNTVLNSLVRIHTHIQSHVREILFSVL